MNQNAKNYVGLVLGTFGVAGSVLEIGALDYNGNVNELFADKTRFPEHIHIDGTAGPNVDAVMYADDLKYDDRRFGCVLALDMLEHDLTPWLSMREFHRVLVNGGHLLLSTCAFGFPMHMRGCDYWRFSIEGIERLLAYGGFSIIDLRENNENQLFALAQKNQGNISKWQKIKSWLG